MKLVQLENYKLTISDEALFIKSFAALWNRDKSEDKSKALSELGYLYFQYDPRSDYMYLDDENERFEAIKKSEGLPATWKPDKLLIAAASDYIKLTQTTSSLLLEDTRGAISKIRRFLRELDMYETDDKGKPKYTINTITSAVNQMPKLAKDLAAAEKEIAKEITENNRMRGKKEKKICEDGM